tara:strand:- start:429 stop:557 length:129 start_codon:yes stop_codon:yes gene_type:complete
VEKGESDGAVVRRRTQKQQSEIKYTTQLLKEKEEEIRERNIL